MLFGVLSAAGISASAEAAGGEWGDLSWSLDRDGVLTVSGQGEMEDLPADNTAWLAYRESIESVVICDGVTSIGEDAFQGCDTLKSVAVPDSVTSIGDCAFQSCASLASVNIPDSVTSIGESAFQSCDSLTSVAVPRSVASIGFQAFSGCEKLTEVTVSSPSTGEGAFFGCPIEKLTITEGVVTIDDYSFNCCRSLKSAVIPESVTSIGNGSFGECSSLTDITIPDSVTYIGSYAFSSCSSLKSITIPDGVTSVEECTFGRCSSLVDVNLPDSITNIGKHAFSSCSSLREINIPKNVNHIVSGAFGSCDNLRTITVSEENPYYHSEGNCIIETASNSLNTGCRNSVIPSYVNSIESEAFYSCTALKSIVIPEGVTFIGESAFDKCTSLESIELPKSLANGTVEFRAFADCDNLKLVYSKSPYIIIDNPETVIVPKGVTPFPHILDEYRVTGSAVIKGDEVDWYKKTEDCAVHYYEDEYDTTCNICGEVRELTVFGDANGDKAVNNLDAACILQHDSGIISLEAGDMSAADVDDDGSVNNIDASLILQLDAGLIAGF